MMSDKKAVFFDADGTICDIEKGVPDSAVESIKKLVANGHQAWLCTGRSRAFVPWYLEQISNCTYRQFTTGFFYGKPDESAQIYDSNTYVKEYTYLGIVGDVTEEGLCKIEQRNKFSVGEEIEIMKPDGENIRTKVLQILNEEGQEQDSAPHPKQVLYVRLDQCADHYDILRRQE